jgi:hypothetical protein
MWWKQPRILSYKTEGIISLIYVGKKLIEQEIISDSDAKPYSMGKKFTGT